MTDQTIRVKLLSRSGKNICLWAQQCPGNLPKWGRCEFIPDSMERNYDWLIVTDDIPRHLPWNREVLSCSPENTLLITTEPSNITCYGNIFSNQFKHLITNQDAHALPHKSAWRTPPGSRWFYGKSYDQIINEPPPSKTRLFSIIATDKQQTHTAHKARFDFTKWLLSHAPDADLLYSAKSKAKIFQHLFNGKAKFVDNKYDMLDPYKYHLAVGNQVGPNILTERITDSFLGYAVPITFGCTNLVDFFPKDSYIEIDIFNPEEAIQIINSHIYDPNDYSRRLDAVVEARRLVIEQYNLPAMLSQLIENAPATNITSIGTKFYGRRMMRARHPQELAQFIFWRLKNSLHTIQAILKQ